MIKSQMENQILVYTHFSFYKSSSIRYIAEGETSPPHQLYPVIYELLKKANAPFNIPESQTDDPNCAYSDDSYFPALPMVHGHGSYVADTRGTSHPTLLPGIFTLFCNHGMVQNQ